MSGEYVVTRKIDKKELKITADPSNQGWSKDTQRFGYRMLLKWGWTEGKGLGASEQGSVDHVKVTKKDDKLGVGVGPGRGTETWLAGSSSFTSILARLNEVYGKKPSTDAEPAPEEEEAPSVTSSKSKKSKKRREQEEEAEEQEAEEQEQEAPVEAEVVDDEAVDEESSKKKDKKKKKKKQKKEKEEAEAEEEAAAAEPETARDESEKEEAKPAAAAPVAASKPLIRHKYHKILKAKTVSNYSETDLNAILGTMKRKEKQEELAKVAAIEAEQDTLVPTLTAKTSMQEYFDSKKKEKKEKR